jgi:hypothetical protein
MMMVYELQAKGLILSINGDKLVFENESPISNKQIDFLKENKLKLVAELRNLALVEIDDDGDVFPLHRFKAEHMPKPKVTDLRWLHNQLEHRPNRIELAAEYSRIYKQTLDSEGIDNRKDSVARFAANKWLLGQQVKD